MCFICICVNQRLAICTVIFSIAVATAAVTEKNRNLPSLVLWSFHTFTLIHKNIHGVIVYGVSDGVPRKHACICVYVHTYVYRHLGYVITPLTMHSRVFENILPF
jgi:hypothetical protein